MIKEKECIICSTNADKKEWFIEYSRNSFHYTECKECGKYKCNRFALIYIESLDQTTKIALSNFIKEINLKDGIPFFTFAEYPKEFYEDLKLSYLAKQKDNPIVDLENET